VLFVGADAGINNLFSLISSNPGYRVVIQNLMLRVAELGLSNSRALQAAKDLEAARLAQEAELAVSREETASARTQLATSREETACARAQLATSREETASAQAQLATRPALPGPEMVGPLAGAIAGPLAIALDQKRRLRQEIAKYRVKYWLMFPIAKYRRHYRKKVRDLKAMLN
jgi:hypothetical protein